MEERLPYEEQLNQQWGDLPLPDENLAWADMRRRLEEEEDRPPVAWWRRGCLLWALLLGTLLAAGWFVLKPVNWFQKEKQKEQVVKTNPPLQNRNEPLKETPGNAAQPRSGENINDTNTVAMNPAKGLPETSANTATKKETGSGREKREGPGKEQKKNSHTVHKQPAGANELVSLSGGNGKTGKKKQPAKTAAGDPGSKKPTEEVISGSNKDTAVAVIPGPLLQKDTGTGNKPAPVQKDTLSANRADTVKQKEKDISKTGSDSSRTKKEKAKTPYILSAGLALHQQLPVDGQKLTPYNSLGRKGSLADYIPAVYLRLEKEKKWFLQSEFRYGAPQYEKEILYRQSIVPDTGALPVYTTTTTSTLKKTFYHQLPLTFNYFIAPGWSVGAGMQWNRFVSAVSEKQVSKKNNFTQLDSVVSKVIGKEDTAGSVFKTSYWQAVFETQYKWKRFSFGARYTFGLEPYIRYQLPGQLPREEKNHSVQVFIRYEWWRQKNKDP